MNYKRCIGHDKNIFILLVFDSTLSRGPTYTYDTFIYNFIYFY